VVIFFASVSRILSRQVIRGEISGNLESNVNDIRIIVIPSLRACAGFRFEGENELKFTIMRRKKRSVAALHEHFCNEISVDFGHLQLESES